MEWRDETTMSTIDDAWPTGNRIPQYPELHARYNEGLINFSNLDPRTTSGGYGHFTVYGRCMGWPHLYPHSELFLVLHSCVNLLGCRRCSRRNSWDMDSFECFLWKGQDELLEWLSAVILALRRLLLSLNRIRQKSIKTLYNYRLIVI